MIKENKVSDNKQIFWLAFGKIIALLATLTIPLFLTRFLDKEEYGFYNQFNTVLFFLTSFFSFGMHSNIFYFYPILKRFEKKTIIIHTIAFLLGFSLLSALFIYIPLFSNFFLANDDLQNYRFIIYFLTVVLTLTSIVHPLYVVKKDIGTSVWFPSFQVGIKAVFIIGFFFIIPTIQSIINAIVVSSVLVLIIVLVYISKTLKDLPKGPLFKKEMAITQLKYNLPIGTAVALKGFSQRFDKLIGITYLSVTSYATYSVAFFGIPGIQQVYDSISQVTVVGMVKCFNAGETAKAHMLYKNMVIKTLAFSVPIIMIVTLNANEIITFLFTKKYADATPLFQMYLLSFIFVMMGAGLILRASGNTKYIIRAFLYASIITIPATYFLMKNFGTFGGMGGALLSIILPKIYQIKKEIEITESTLLSFLPLKIMGKIFLISLIVIIPFAYLRFFLLERNILNVIFTSTVYLLIIAAIEIRMNVFIIGKEKLIDLKNRIIKRI
jgi:O-antigen/teichoic acid export membrane protein